MEGVLAAHGRGDPLPDAGIEATAQIYLLLGRLFSYPAEEIQVVTRHASLNAAVMGLVESLPFTVSFGGFPAPSLLPEELESEYIRLFDLGFAGSPPCSLYEADYRKGELSRAEILEELFRFYGHFDVSLGGAERDYPDHLVVELEFMAFLAGKEAGAIARGTQPDSYRLAQKDFLERHLGCWVPRLDSRIQRVEEPFYRGVSAFMREFIEGHLSSLRPARID